MQLKADFKLKSGEIYSQKIQLKACVIKDKAKQGCNNFINKLTWNFHFWAYSVVHDANQLSVSIKKYDGLQHDDKRKRGNSKKSDNCFTTDSKTGWYSFFTSVFIGRQKDRNAVERIKNPISRNSCFENIVYDAVMFVIYGVVLEVEAKEWSETYDPLQKSQSSTYQ